MARTSPESAADARPRMRSSDIVIDDERLSLAAKGVFVMVALLGDGCRVADLVRHARDEAVGVSDALRELTRLRYVRVDRDTVRIEDAPYFGVPEV